MNYKLRLFLIIGIASLTFSSFSKKENSEDNKQAIEELNQKSDSFPDGIYISSGGTSIKETYVNNKLIKRVVDGKEVSIDIDFNKVIYYGSDSEDRSLKLCIILDKSDYSCISSRKAVNSNNEFIWIVEYSKKTPCWYQEYKNHTNKSK